MLGGRDRRAATRGFRTIASGSRPAGRPRRRAATPIFEWVHRVPGRLRGRQAAQASGCPVFVYTLDGAHMPASTISDSNPSSAGLRPLLTSP